MLQRQLDELGADEGIRMLVYDDATGRPIGPGTLVRGHPTIGIGRALDVHGIRADEAHYLLANDIAAVEAALSRLDWYQRLDQVRRGVCTNLAFNMGVRGLQSFVGMISDIEAAEHDLTAAMQQLAQGSSTPRQTNWPARIGQAGAATTPRSTADAIAHRPT